MEVMHEPPGTERETNTKINRTNMRKKKAKKKAFPHSTSQSRDLVQNTTHIDPTPSSVPTRLSLRPPPARRHHVTAPPTTFLQPTLTQKTRVPFHRQANSQPFYARHIQDFPPEVTTQENVCPGQLRRVDGVQGRRPLGGCAAPDRRPGHRAGDHPARASQSLPVLPLLFYCLVTPPFINPYMLHVTY